MRQDISYIDHLDRQIFLVIEKNCLLLRVSLFRKPFALDKSDLRIGIIGDTHGELERSLDEFRRWTELTGQSIDLFLQVGDIGAYDDLSVLDKNTAKLARKKPEILGFNNIINGSKKLDSFFGENGLYKDARLYFIDGNHDDVQFLNDRFKSKYECIDYLKSGEIIEVNKENINIKFAGIGWYSTKKNIDTIEFENPEILITHSNQIIERNVDFSVLTSRFHFFGHKKSAHKYSDISNNSYGLDFMMNGILHVKSQEESLFMYLADFNL